jgi:hypothetical protein
MQFRCAAAGLPKPLECNPRIQGTTIVHGLNWLEQT